MATKKTPEVSSWATALSRQATAPTTLPAEPVTEPEPTKRPRTRQKAAETPTEPVPASKPARAPRMPRKAAEAAPAPVSESKPATRTRTPRKPDSAPVPVAVPVKVRPPVKRAVGFNLPEDVVELIDLAVAAEAAKGKRVREGEVVTAAIRKVYGKLAR